MCVRESVCVCVCVCVYVRERMRENENERGREGKKAMRLCWGLSSTTGRNGIYHFRDDGFQRKQRFRLFVF